MEYAIQNYEPMHSGRIVEAIIFDAIDFIHSAMILDSLSCPR